MSELIPQFLIRDYGSWQEEARVCRDDCALQSLSKSTVLAGLDYFSFSSVELAGIPCTVGRLGYTGEIGFEIIVDRSKGKALWSELARQARPAGFAAIDSLRIEAGFMLFANDLVLRPTISELGVDPTVSEDKCDDRFIFICCTAPTDEDPTLWCLDNRYPAPPIDNQVVVTSACFSSAADSVLILGFVHPKFITNKPLLDPTGTFVNIRRVSRPFFDPQKLRPRGALVMSYQ